MRRWTAPALAGFLLTPVPAAATSLESFIEAAERIKQIEGGRVSAVFWDLTNATERDFRALGAAGFNEVIVDGHHFGEGHIPLPKVAIQVAAAGRAGISSFKFVRGSPDWAGAKQGDAREKVTRLAERILDLKGFLRDRGDRDAAQTLKGIVVNVEPYAQKGWNYDLRGYVRLHDDLERIAAARGLSYETFDAFWIGERLHESGNEMTGYRVNPGRTTYIMSYRRDSSEAFRISGFFATRVPHVAGFDLVAEDPVGFREHPEELGSAVADYVERTLSAPDRERFRGVFVNASRVADLISFIQRASQT